MSKTGVIQDCARSDRDIQIPSGIPSARQSNVAAEIIVTVETIGSHISRKPITKNAAITPIETLMLLEPSHARAPATAKKIGQGVDRSNFSMTIKKVKRGSKNDSILFPNSLVKSLNAASTQFLELIITSPGMEMTLFTNMLKSEVFTESTTLEFNDAKYST